LQVEKRTPHCKLAVVKALIDAGQVRTPKAAREGGVALGFDFDGMLAVIQSLTAADFYKSMTTHADHRVWQDVYCPTTPAGAVYLKLTVVDDVLIVSFKEL
jgi:motility quorum-sensing regulator / GCU-specific mRNA interferase toxin